MRGHTGQAVVDAFDKLHAMQTYLAGQFRTDMPREEAVAYFGARAVLFRLQNALLVENGLPPITMAETRPRQEVEARG